jgi:hypothetical protein
VMETKVVKKLSEQGTTLRGAVNVVEGFATCGTGCICYLYWESGVACYLGSAIPLRGCYQRYGAPCAAVSPERYRVPKFPAPAGSVRLSSR